MTQSSNLLMYYIHYNLLTMVEFAPPRKANGVVWHIGLSKGAIYRSNLESFNTRWRPGRVFGRANAGGLGKIGTLSNAPAAEDCFCFEAWRICSCASLEANLHGFSHQLTGTTCGHKIVKRTRFKRKKWLSETMRLIPFFFLVIVAFSVPAAPGQAIKPIPPDERFKADILLVVAHPDDETEVTGYLARAIFDEHKRVAVIFGTRGDGGGNAAGEEQAAALGAEREIEARQALNVLGITNI
jgi:hypothetical protein